MDTGWESAFGFKPAMLRFPTRYRIRTRSWARKRGEDR